MAVEVVAGVVPALLLEEVEMKFCLTYDGPLPAAPNGRGCVEIKHQIRRQISQQLKDLVEEHEHAIGQAITNWKEVGGIAFFPLVRSSLHMVCELDILFLRREKPGALITKPRDQYGGDLDNRLKIFFDALRMPHEIQELPETATLEEYMGAMYCLLEDDALITKFQVESATLLGKTGPQNEKDVRLVTQVTIKLTRSTEENRSLSI